jgi:hypothetical protein
MGVRETERAFAVDPVWIGAIITVASASWRPIHDCPHPGLLLDPIGAVFAPMKFAD